jgi:hypothetical protein
MNPTKARFKIDFSESFGREYEKREEEADHSFYRQEGARDALKKAAKEIEKMLGYIDEEVESGALTSFVGEPLLVAKHTKKWINTAIGSLDGLATKAEVARISYGGKKKGLEEAKEYALKAWKEEKAKLALFNEAMKKLQEDAKNGIETDLRSPDGHPGPSLKSQRLAEEAMEAEKAKEKDNPDQEAPKEEETTPKAEAPQAAPKTSNPLAGPGPNPLAKKKTKKEKATKKDMGIKEPRKKRLRQPKKKR